MSADHDTAHDVPRVPHGSAAWWLLVLLSAALIGAGAFCFVRQEQLGFIASNLRAPGHGGAAWGLHISLYVFLVGASFAGITVAGIARLMNVEALRPITRLAELLTISTLVAGASAVMADLGRPEVGIVNLPKYARPSSPFFGTFTLVVSGYLFSSLVYFFLAGRADAARLAKDPDRPLHWLYLLWASGYTDSEAERRRHRRVSYVLALTILPLLVVAHSTLGFIFGIQPGRPGWFSALMAPSFVVMAGVSGTGGLILLIIVTRKLFDLKIPDTSIKWLGNLLWVLAVVYLYFIITDEMTAAYAAPTADRHVAHVIVSGPFAPFFWTVVGSLLLTAGIPFFLYLRGKTSVFWVGVAGFTANVAAMAKRLLIVVPSQTHGTMLPVETPHWYIPSVLEVGAALGLFGVVALLILVFGRIFPLVPSSHEAHGPPPRDVPRVVATTVWGLGAAGLITFGLVDSFRLLRPSELDPVFPFAPVIFATGVMTLFLSAAVYELFPKWGAAEATAHEPPPHAPNDHGSGPWSWPTGRK